jgi:hypothetical protein
LLYACPRVAEKFGLIPKGPAEVASLLLGEGTEGFVEHGGKLDGGNAKLQAGTVTCRVF